MFPIKAYLSFLARSTNQHGVHSPFVFRLVTQCFYNKKKIPCSDYPKQFSSKKGQFLLRLSSYLRIKSLKIYSQESDFKDFLLKNIPESSTNLSQKKDMLLIFQPLEWPSTDELLSQLHNDSVVVVVNPHSGESLPHFREWAKDKRFSVIIDTFSFALFFIRKEQERETFFIRL